MRCSGDSAATVCGRSSRLLVLLLRLVAARVEAVQRAAAPVGAVAGAAVPHVRVHDDDGAGLAGDELLVRQRACVPGAGSRRQVCERGIIRVAPLSAVKSSSIQIVLHTQ